MPGRFAARQSGNAGGHRDVGNGVTDVDQAPPDDSATTPEPNLWRAGLAGVVAAAVALATGELVSAVAPGSPSLIGAVGDWFIDGPGGPLAKPAIELFGTNDKPALVIGIVLVTLALGWPVGRAAARRPWVGPAAFGTFGVLGAAAAIADPVDDTAWAALGAAAAAVAGTLTLWLLLRVLATGRAVPVTTTRTILDPADGAASRRAFVGWAGAAGAFAALLAAGSRAVRGPSAAQQARDALVLPTTDGGIDVAATRSATLDVAGISPYVTPNDRFYRIDTALVTPQVDPAAWSLQLTGMVDRPLTLSFDELLAQPMITEAVTIACVSNEVGGKLVGNAVWQGVPLGHLLEQAGVQPGAQQIVGRSVDGFTVGFPLGLALDGRVAMVAVGMNGEPLPVDHGFPARLIVAGVYGYVSATKWLSEIELTTWEGFDAYWIPRGWSKEAPIKTQSRIDVPRGDVRPGPTPVAGVAWAPGRGIDRVEVQVDEGEWIEARLGDVVSDDTWRQWVVTWDATPGDHTLRVRATDGTSEAQTDERRPPAPDGATGWHTVRLTVADA